MQEFARAYEVRRRKAYEILNCVPGVHMALPESGFLGWIDVSELGNSTEIAQYLVTHARVSLNDGVNYGPGRCRDTCASCWASTRTTRR